MGDYNIIPSTTESTRYFGSLINKDSLDTPLASVFDDSIKYEYDFATEEGRKSLIYSSSTNVDTEYPVLGINSNNILLRNPYQMATTLIKFDNVFYEKISYNLDVNSRNYNNVLPNLYLYLGTAPGLDDIANIKLGSSGTPYNYIATQNTIYFSSYNVESAYVSIYVDGPGYNGYVQGMGTWMITKFSGGTTVPNPSKAIPIYAKNADGTLTVNMTDKKRGAIFFPKKIDRTIFKHYLKVKLNNVSLSNSVLGYIKIGFTDEIKDNFKILSISDKITEDGTYTISYPRNRDIDCYMFIEFCCANVDIEKLSTELFMVKVFSSNNVAYLLSELTERIKEYRIGE